VLTASVLARVAGDLVGPLRALPLIFLMTQYLQFVQRRSAIETGLVMLPLPRAP
jgi:hypothetical protein